MKTCSETFLFEKDLKWENPAPGINRQIMAYDGQLMMVKVKFDKGAIGVIHVALSLLCARNKHSIIQPLRYENDPK